MNMNPEMRLAYLLNRREVARDALAKVQSETEEDIRLAIEDCRKRGWSYRKIGKSVGLSGQRIEQLHKNR